MRDAVAASHRSDYEAVTLGPRENNYALVAVRPPQPYDAWTKLDKFATASNRTDYEDFTQVH
jgi:hypothetical protein